MCCLIYQGQKDWQRCLHLVDMGLPFLIKEIQLPFRQGSWSARDLVQEGRKRGRDVVKPEQLLKLRVCCFYCLVAANGPLGMCLSFATNLAVSSWLISSEGVFAFVTLDYFIKEDVFLWIEAWDNYSACHRGMTASSQSTLMLSTSS